MVAEQESARRSERTKSAHAAIAKAGQWHGGVVPVGFQRVRDESGEFVTGRIEHHPIEAPAVRRAFVRVLEESWSLGSAALAFTEETGRKLDPRALRNVLTSAPIAGLRLHVPSSGRDPWGAMRIRRDPLSDVVRNSVDAQWEPIVSFTDWKRMQAKINDPRRDTRKGAKPSASLLSGLLRCTACQESLGYKTESYQCRRCNQSLSVRRVESWVIDLMTAYVQETSSNERTSLAEEPRLGRSVVQLRAEAERKRERLAKVHAWFEEGRYDDDEQNYLSLTESLGASIAELEGQLTSMEHEPPAVVLNADMWGAIVEELRQATGSAQKSARMQARKLIASTFECFEVRRSERGMGGQWRPDERITPVWMGTESSS